MKTQLSRTRASTDPSTTVRHYSLFVDAHDTPTEAQAAKHQAFLNADKEPTHANIQAFLDADKALTTAEENFKQVKLMQKHVKGTVQS